MERTVQFQWGQKSNVFWLPRIAIWVTIVAGMRFYAHRTNAIQSYICNICGLQVWINWWNDYNFEFCILYLMRTFNNCTKNSQQFSWDFFMFDHRMCKKKYIQQIKMRFLKMNFSWEGKLNVFNFSFPRGISHQNFYPWIHHNKWKIASIVKPDLFQNSNSAVFKKYRGHVEMQIIKGKNMQ